MKFVFWLNHITAGEPLKNILYTFKAWLVYMVYDYWHYRSLLRLTEESHSLNSVVKDL
jgi:hypothetical protein